MIKLSGKALSEAVYASRAPWRCDPIEEGNGALQHDLGVKCDPKTHRVSEVAGQPLEEERLYDVLVDSYD